LDICCLGGNERVPVILEAEKPAEEEKSEPMNRKLRVLQKKRQRILLVERKSSVLRVDAAPLFRHYQPSPKRKDDQRAL
jgi:hypothetical protein